MKLIDETGRPCGPKARLQRRCIGCGTIFPVKNVMVSAVGLCAECSDQSPFGWRTVYDRERRIGRITSNLAPAR
jgi:hypothetical protein